MEFADIATPSEGMKLAKFQAKGFYAKVLGKWIFIPNPYVILGALL